MPLTKQGCQDLITDNLGGEPGVLSALAMLNSAGQQIVSLRSWNWLRRPAATLSFVADQDYVTLPSDLSEILEVRQGPGICVELVDLSELDEYRLGIRRLHSGFVMALSMPVDQTSGLPTPRLEIEPVPTEAQADALRLAWYAGWVDVSADAAQDSVIPIPAFIEPLMLEMLVAVARGLDEDDNASMSARVSAVRAGAVYRAAVNADVRLQRQMGTIEPLEQVGIYHQRPTGIEIVD